jgi:trehalose-6-phosphate synthase
MSYETDLALLAAGSYWDIRSKDQRLISESNRAPLPANSKLITDSEFVVSSSGGMSSNALMLSTKHVRNFCRKRVRR